MLDKVFYIFERRNQMKALSRKAQDGRARIAAQEETKCREEYLASLTEEEREAYLEKERHDQAEAVKAFASLIGMTAALGGNYQNKR